MERPRGRGREALLSRRGLAFGGCDVELAVHAVRRGEFTADSQLLAEPLHGLGAFEGPDDVDVLSDGFSVTHLLYQVQEMGDDGCDAGTACKEDNGIKGC